MEREYTAFFDSGIGGLTVLREFFRRYPSEKCIYLGDNENAPYGNRPEWEIKSLSERAFRTLAKYPLKAAVIACNTVTAECADRLREKYPFPIVGMEPAVKPAAAFAGEGKVLLLATRATLASPRVHALVRTYENSGGIVAHCPERLAGDIESRIFDLRRVRLREYLPADKFSAVVLGCTHYIFLRTRMQSFYGCRVFDGNAGTVARLAQVARLGPPAPQMAETAADVGRNAATSGTADHRDVQIGTADHFAQKTNKCSKNFQISPKNCPIFIGKSANFNETVCKMLLKDQN